MTAEGKHSDSEVTVGENEADRGMTAEKADPKLSPKPPQEPLNSDVTAVWT